jgi:hypothetical protein
MGARGGSRDGRLGGLTPREGGYAMDLPHAGVRLAVWLVTDVSRDPLSP